MQPLVTIKLRQALASSVTKVLLRSSIDTAESMQMPAKFYRNKYHFLWEGLYWVTSQFLKLTLFILVGMTTRKFGVDVWSSSDCLNDVQVVELKRDFSGQKHERAVRTRKVAVLLCSLPNESHEKVVACYE